MCLLNHVNFVIPYQVEKHFQAVVPFLSKGLPLQKCWNIITMITKVTLGILLPGNKILMSSLKFTNRSKIKIASETAVD